MTVDSKKKILKEHLYFIGMDLYDCYFRPDDSLKEFLNSKFRKGKFGFKTIRHILYDFKTDQLKLEKQYKYFIKDVVIESEELKLACKEFYERIIGETNEKRN